MRWVMDCSTKTMEWANVGMQECYNHKTLLNFGPLGLHCGYAMYIHVLASVPGLPCLRALLAHFNFVGEGNEKNREGLGGIIL